MPINDILDRLEETEQRFVGSHFLAPILGDGPIHVRLAGVVCRLRPMPGVPESFGGWAIWRARSTSLAEFVRPARLSEISAYLDLFPKVRLILTTLQGAAWLAFPAQTGGQRFQINGPVLVWLAEAGLESFDTVLTRFDGRLFWYAQRDPSRDPALADYLRAQVAGSPAPSPETLHKPGLSREEREAYAWTLAVRDQGRQAAARRRLERALDHAGAHLRSYAEQAEVYVVTYEVDGQAHVSTVRRDDLSVVTAGICLSGQDGRFDLTSLVGVLREGTETHQLVWVG